MSVVCLFSRTHAHIDARGRRRSRRLNVGRVFVLNTPQRKPGRVTGHKRLMCECSDRCTEYAGEEEETDRRSSACYQYPPLPRPPQPPPPRYAGAALRAALPPSRRAPVPPRARDLRSSTFRINLSTFSWIWFSVGWFQ